MSTKTRTKPGLLRRIIQSSEFGFAGSVLVFLGVWYLLAGIISNPALVPSPRLVAIALMDILVSGKWTTHVYATMRRVFFGLGITMIIGTFIGVLMGWYRFWAHMLEDWIVVGLALPSLVSAIFAAMILGFTPLTPAAAGAATAFPFVTHNVYSGVKDIDHRLIEMSKNYGVRNNQVIKNVLLPGVLPGWFSGLRYGLLACWQITVLAETIIAGNGLGFQIKGQLSQFNLTELLAWVVLFVAIIMVIEYGIIRQVEKWIFRWREETIMGFGGGQ